MMIERNLEINTNLLLHQDLATTTTIVGIFERLVCKNRLKMVINKRYNNRETYLWNNQSRKTKIKLLVTFF